MSGVLRWEEPPPDARRGRRPGAYWRAIADDLKSNPGRWACIHEGPRQGALVARVKQGRSAFAPAGAFDARERQRDGGWLVYARYVGGSDV